MAASARNMLLPSLLMRGAVQKGYASVGTDMGYFGESDVDGRWALNAPEKVWDYGWRANRSRVPKPRNR